MDWNKLLQGVGGRLLRQFLGHAVNKGINRIGGPAKPKGQMTESDRHKQAQSVQTQKRLREAIKIGRRFWR